MIVYPTWNTTPSSKVKEQTADHESKQRVFHDQMKGEQLPLFIDDYSFTEKSEKFFSTFSELIDKQVFKINLEQILNSVYKPQGKIPFPKTEEEANKTPELFIASDTFDPNLFLQTFYCANSVTSPTGVATVIVNATKEQLPAALFSAPSEKVFTNQELAEMFGLASDPIAASSLLSVTVQVYDEDPFFDPVYKVIFERSVPIDDSLF